MSHQAAPAYSGAEADLDAYAAQAAHQLGEAVALLRGYLAVLEQRGERDPELDDALRGLSVGTERAQRFVDDLLDLAAAGRTEPAAELFALDEALDTARRRLARELQEAVAEVRAADLPVVRADRELVARLLVHGDTIAAVGSWPEKVTIAAPGAARRSAVSSASGGGPGISRSSTTTSGCLSEASLMAASPSPTSPTISTAPSASSA